MKKLRKLTADDVAFTVTCEPEDLPIEGNAMASGDDAVDQECYEGIRKELARGNEWAWCSVKVEALWESPTGQVFKGVCYLGGCSYESEKDFSADGGYLPQLKEDALEDLNESIGKLAKALPLEVSE